MTTQLVGLAKEALEIETDIWFRFKDRQHTTADDFQLIIFDQVWGSTALGFGGIGGQAMTRAKTYVFIPEIDGENCIVYFAGRYAYSVPYSQTFIEDVRQGRLEPVSRQGKYLNTNE